MRRFSTVLLAGFTVSAVYAQAPDDRARDHQDQARGRASATQADRHHMGVDREAAIGHALGMAIEGSALWHFAQKAEAQQTKQDHKPGHEQAMRDPAAVLEQRARDAFRSSERLFKAVMQDEKGTQGSKNQNGDRAAGNNDEGSEHMAKNQACEEYYRAARDYSRALETSCSKTRQAGAQAPASISSDVCAENTAKVVLINCAVKGAVQGVALQQMLRHHGEHDRTTQALESHAEEMIASSRHAIDSIKKDSPNQGQTQNAARQQTKDQARNDGDKARIGKKPSLIADVNNPADTKNDALARDSRQARIDQGTFRRDAARPTYNDERDHSNLKPGEAITVSQLANLGREVIRSVERLNQDQGRMQPHDQNLNQDQNRSRK
jgi:hypothetical protein